jgi:FkbM family methyltransferase
MNQPIDRGSRVNITMPVKRLLRRLGFDIIRFEPNRYPALRRQRLMDTRGINVVLDVGANHGQYASGLRKAGYRGRIVSFEPLAAEYRALSAAAAGDAAWKTMNCAVGDVDGFTEINISGGYTQVSSLLEMLPSAVERRPIWKTTEKEKIEVRRLDSVFDSLCSAEDRVMLKIDTQGYEKRVLDGAEKVLPRIALLQLEMSLIPLYQGETLFHEMCPFLARKGFQLVAVEPGMNDEKTGRLFQLDGIFERGSGASGSKDG